MTQLGPYMEIRLTPERGQVGPPEWLIVNKKSGGALGHIAWYARWASFCFFPIGGTVFDSSCLSEISRFCRSATINWDADQRVRRGEGR